MLVWVQSTQEWHTLGGVGLESLLILKVCFKGTIFHPHLFTRRYLGSERVVTYSRSHSKEVEELELTCLLDPEHSSNCPNTEHCLPWPCTCRSSGSCPTPASCLRPTPLWDPFLSSLCS